MNDNECEVSAGPASGQFIAFYGTLLLDEGAQQRLDVSGKLKLIGPSVIPGDLFDLGEFPGLVPGDGRVIGEVYEILDPTVLAILDHYEGVATSQLDSALYTRRNIRLLEPEMDAWVYHFNGDISGCPRIRCGNWIHYLRSSRVQE